MTNMTSWRAELVERVALAIDEAEVGYSIQLTRLVDGEATYTLKITGDDQEHTFPSHAEASAFLGDRQYLAKATAAADILIPAILERAAGDDIRSKIKDVLHAYRADSGDFIHHPGPYADRILAAIRSLKDTPDVEA